MLQDGIVFCLSRLFVPLFDHLFVPINVVEYDTPVLFYDLRCRGLFVHISLQNI